MPQQRLATVQLAFATGLFALGPVVLKLLVMMGGKFGLEEPGAISFCNVLFVGNLCAGLVTLAMYRPRPLLGELRALPRRAWGFLAVGAIVSTIYPALVFTALERTSVIDVVLLSRFNGIVLVILGYFTLGSKVRRADAAGYLVIALGVVSLVAIKNGGLRLVTGQVLVLSATIFYALTEVIGTGVLRTCSVQAYVFFRNMASAVMFFGVAVVVFGFEHFMDAFSGRLWILMLIYAGFAVVAAQLLWLRATRKLPLGTVANSQMLNPALSIGLAFLLLREIPAASDWLVMAIIAVGMLIPWLAHRSRRPERIAGAVMPATGMTM